MIFPWFVAKRYIFSKKDSRFINFISAISVVGIALGVATLIIALSVLNGFEKTLTDKVVNFDSHIKITSFRNTLPDYKATLPKLDSYLKDFDPTIVPFASKLAIVSKGKLKEGLNLIGISKDAPKPEFIKDIVKGKFLLSDSGSNFIVVGKNLADKLFLKVGDNVTVFALNNDEIPSPSNLPNIEKFRVSGIFESGMSEYDDMFAYIELKTAQKLFGIGDNINGYNIRLGDISKLDSLASYIAKKLRYPHFVRTVYQLHNNIFTWIDLQKKPIPIILGLIIIVAVFNIVGTLLMVVLEKTNSIGVLKSLGAKRKQIIGIFIIQGISLAITGILLGILLATLLMELQLRFDVIKIPSSVYFMNKVPIQISSDIYILVSLVTFALCILASVLPSFIASKIRPIESLRFS